MTINISIPDVGQNLHPQITVLGVGGSGGNAVNNMINSNLEGVDFVIANTDAQALQNSSCKKKIQLGVQSTRGLGAGMRPDIGRQAAEEAIQDLSEKFEGSHMLFIAAGMGGGTGTGAAPVIAKLAREKGILTVGVITKPFHFEGSRRMKLAEKGIEDLQQHVDTLLTIPNQNLFRIANEKTTFADAFKMADDVLYAGVRGVTDLMIQPGMINLDFSDIKTVMSEMGKAMMGTGEAQGEGRSIAAAEAAIANPLIDDVSLKGAKGLIINITGGKDITLYEVDEAANRIKQEVDEEANIIYGTTCDERLEGVVRVSIVATGIDANIKTSENFIDSYSKLQINNEIYKKDQIKTDELDINVPSVTSLDQEYSENETPKIFSATTPSLEENNISSEIQPVSSNNENDIDDTSEFLEDKSEVEKNKEEVLPNISDQNIETDEKYEELSSNTDHIDSISDISNNAVETSVRRLSLFDTLSTESNEAISNPVSLSDKSEPVLSSEEGMDNNSNISDNDNNEEIHQSEFDPEENNSSELDEEFNQETEEELLDIPTFLRRQAN